jgi:hypothetical protein
VRLAGIAREIPPRLAAAGDRLHMFAGDSGMRIGP